MRRTLAVLLIAGAALVFPVAASGQPAANETAAFERLATCARDEGQLSVLLLIDESGSLGETDADAQRVVAAQTAIRSLGRLGDDPDITVDLAMAGFAVGYELVQPWTEVDGSTVPTLADRVEYFRGQDDGLDTDFGEAFLGANEELSRRAAEGQGSGCKMLLLFTDGDYDVEERDSPGRREQGLEKSYAPGVSLDQPGNAQRVEELGRSLLCDGEGLVDQMRAEDLVLVTIALEEEISEEAQGFLRAMSTGDANGATCGDRRGADLGAYVAAGNLAELLAGFNRAANEIAGGTSGFEQNDLPVCALERCAEGSREFTLNGAYEQFHLLVNSAAEDVAVELAAPETDDVLVLEPGVNGAFELGSVDLDVVWLSPIDVAIDGSLPSDDDGWQGTWTLTFVDQTGRHADALASAQLYLFGGLTPELVGEPLFRMGEQASFGIRIVDAAGTPRTPADFVQEATVVASVTDPVAGRTQELAVEGPAADGSYTAMWPVPAEIEAATVNLSLRLEVVAQTGIALQPRLRSYAVPVQPPVTYPSLGPVELRLTNVSDLTGEAVGTILVTGGAESSGCVWFEGANVQRLPRNADGVTTAFEPSATTQADCIAVRAGERQEVELRVAVDRVASGGVQGRVEARLVSDATPAVLNAELPFAFDMHRPVDQVRRAGLFAALLLVGLLLPLMVLWLLNWWGARYEPLDRLRTAAVRVHITPDGRLSRVVAGRDEPLSFVSKDFHSTPGPSEPARQASVEDLAFSSKVPLFPFRAAHGVVASASSHVAGSEGTMGRGDPVRGKIPFSLARQWVLILDWFETSEDADPDVRATLRVFLPEGAVLPQIPGLVDELARAVPPTAQDLAREADRRPRSGPPDPSEASDEAPTPLDQPPAWTPMARGRGGTTTARATPDPSSPWRPSASGATATDPPTGPGSPAPLDEGDSGTPSGWQPPKR